MLKRCPSCLAWVPSGAGENGPCPACQLRLGFAAGDESGPAPASTGPGGAGLGTLGRYLLLEVLGRGAHGVVYRAMDPALGRQVALKTLVGRMPGGDSSAERERFRREASIVARLDHPHIVPLLDHGEDNGVPWLVQKFFAGGDLSQRLEKPVPPRQAASWAHELADAVAMAHRQGVLHRDIKPSNVYLDDEGRVHLGDFGIARSMNESNAGSTLAGQAVGTPAYMAPEQARGISGEVGPAVDIHGLGALLYHALTGLPPFRGANLESTLRQVMELEPVPVRRLNPSVPVDLETVCLKCLEKDPRRRYRNAAELRQDLDRFLEGSPVLARPLSGLGRLWRWCRRRPAVATLSAALTISLVGGLAGTSAALVRMRVADGRRQETRDKLAFEMFDVWARNREFRRGLDAMAEILRESPDHLAAVRRAWSTLDGRGVPVPLFEVGPSNCLAAAFDTAGSRLVFWTFDGRLVLVDADQARELGEHALPPGLKLDALGFSPAGDGVWARTEDRRLLAWELPSWHPLEGGAPPVWVPPRPPLPASVQIPGDEGYEFSPDGRHALIRRNGRSYDLVEVATGKVVRRGEDDYLLDWDRERPGVFPRSPISGRFLTWGADRLLVRNVATGELDCDSVSLGKPIEFGCWHPDGRRVLAVPLEGRPVLFSVARPAPVQPSHRLGSPVSYLDYSPDGRFLAVGGVSNGVHLLASGTQRTVHENLPALMAARAAAWTDRGLLAVDADGRAFLVDPDAGSTRFLFRAAGLHVALATSLDGRWIATVSEGGALELWDLRRAAGPPVAAAMLGIEGVSKRPGVSNQLMHLMFDRRAKRLATTFASGRADVWSVPELRRTSLAGGGPFAFGAAFHPTEDRLVMGEMAGRVLGWSLRDGAEPKATTFTSLPYVGRVAFDSTGRHLLLVAMGGSAHDRPWPPEVESRSRWISGGGAWQVAALEDEPSCLVAYTKEGKMELRSLALGLVQARWNVPAQGMPNLLAVSPDGNRIAVGYGSGEVFEVRVPPSRLPVPDWFVPWVEAMGEEAIGRDPNGSRSALRRITELRQRLATLPGEGFWERWGRSIADPEAPPSLEP